MEDRDGAGTSGERRRLDRRRVLDAALALVDRDGPEGLTMRRLGRELGVEAMSLYHHVAGKEALLDGVVERLLAEVEIPAPDPDDWESGWRAVVLSYRRMALAHPRAFPLVVTRTLATDLAIARQEAALDILRAAGFDETAAWRVFLVTAGFVNGFALEEIQRRAAGNEAGNAAIDDEFAFGLDVVAAGVRAALGAAG